MILILIFTSNVALNKDRESPASRGCVGYFSARSRHLKQSPDLAAVTGALPNLCREELRV